MKRPPRLFRQVPRDLRRDHRTTGEGYSDGGSQIDSLRHCCGMGERQKRVVRRFGSPQPVEAMRFYLPGDVGGSIQVSGENGNVKFHGQRPLAKQCNFGVIIADGLVGMRRI